MKRFVFYHEKTGVLHGRTLMLDVNDLENCLRLNTPDGHVPLEHAHAYPGHHRFDLESQQMIEAIPPAPNDDHEWDGARHRWILRPAIVDAERQRQTKTAALLEEQRKTVVGFLLGRGGAERLREIENELDQLMGCK